MHFQVLNFPKPQTGTEVLTELIKSRQDVLLLDINMPGRSGMEVLKDVKHTYPHFP